MPIRNIRHVTTYHYNQPVAFGEHRMMLRPRDDDDQKVIEAELEITPKPKQLAWTRDSLGNHVATAQFDDRARELCFVSSIRLDHAPADFRATDIADFARTYPFAYAPEDRAGIEPFIQPLSPHPAIDRWSAAFFRDDGSADTYELLGAMTRTIRRTFKHVSRHEKGIQLPVCTLNLGSGSCRDLAVLMITALRSRGIAARFVSGYLHLTDDDDDDDDDRVAGGNTHAWVQVCVPGAGWIDFDPSGGSVGNEKLIRVAVAHHPREAIPLQGTWFGAAADYLAMKVAVKVTTAAATGA
jgi:transglutaminase-like putative cysteine protease